MKIQIQKPVRANDSSVQEQDIFNVKTALNGLGYYDEPKYGFTVYPDRQMFDSIKSFQGDNDLKVDGVMNPDGETIQEMNKQLKISARTPRSWCTVCGGPHGGSKGDVCPDCDSKQG